MQATISKENIGSESYYNCVQLCRLTGFANPVAAIKQLNAVLIVRKDDCGNIRQVIGSNLD